MLQTESLYNEKMFTNRNTLKEKKKNKQNQTSY